MQSKKTLIYETVMSSLALIAVTIAIIDIIGSTNFILKISDNIILVIFIVDYIIRFVAAKKKKQFIKNNIPDLIAVIPFNSIFKIFRIAKLARLTRLSKLSKFIRLSKLTVYILRFSKHITIFMNTNGFKYSLLITIILINIGAIGISQFENMEFPDALWWAFVTATTVGYGDISPSSGPGRITAVILMIAGIGLIGSLTSTITSYFFLRQPKKSPKTDVIQTLQKQLENIDNLSNDDIDEIYSILKSLKNKE